MIVSIMREISEDVLEKCREITGADVRVMDPEGADVQVIYRKYSVTKDLKMIQTIYAGVDHLDFKSVPERVTICSNAGAFSEPVAEHAFAMLLSVNKRIMDFEKQARSGVYEKLPVNSLIGKKLGIFGYGGIGRSMSRIAKALNMVTTAYSRNRHGDENLDRFVNSPEELFMESDIVALAMPLTNLTRGIIDSHLLSKFRGETIVNVARADVVKENDMLDYLRNNPGKQYLTDVWWREPQVDFPIPDNVLLTPHVGGINRSLEVTAVYRACQNVRKFIDGKIPEHIVDRKEYST